MGLLLSPVIATFFMEDFEVRVFRQAANKLSHWFWYVDDTFINWPHGLQQLDGFLFIWIVCTKKILPWKMGKMDIQPSLTLISTKRQMDPCDTRFIENLLIEIFNWMQNHTISCWISKLFLIPWYTQEEFYAMVDSLQDELEFLKITSKQNGYSYQQIQCVLNPTPKTPNSTRSQC